MLNITVQIDNPQHHCAQMQGAILRCIQATYSIIVKAVQPKGGSAELTHLSSDLSMLLCMARAAARLRILSSRVLLNWNTI